MYMRLAFAVAAHLEPEVLVVDEVLAVGDAEFQKKCLGKMSQIARGGRTVLFVSHNLTAVAALCKSGLLMDRGHVVESGSVDKVLSNYLGRGAESSGHTVLTEHLGNDSSTMRFIAIRVCQEGTESAGIVSTQSNVEVRISYEILQPISGIEVGFNLFTESNQCLIASSDVDTNLDLDRHRPAGRYEGRCIIPSIFLRSGRYSITVTCSRPNVEVITKINDAIDFEVIDPDGVPSRIGQIRTSLLTPRLDWATIALRNAPSVES
jgi:lipopolysaccharide transport system ATP-binding protein